VSQQRAWGVGVEAILGLKCSGLPGSGAPAVDLVVRVKPPAEKLTFALDQGGAGAALVEVPVGGGAWSAQDVLEPERALDQTVQAGVWRTTLSLPPLRYRVLWLRRR